MVSSDKAIVTAFMWNLRKAVRPLSEVQRSSSSLHTVLKFLHQILPDVQPGSSRWCGARKVARDQHDTPRDQSAGAAGCFLPVSDMKALPACHCGISLFLGDWRQMDLCRHVLALYLIPSGLRTASSPVCSIFILVPHVAVQSCNLRLASRTIQL